MGMFLLILINVAVSINGWRAFKSGDPARARRFLFEPAMVARGENRIGMLLSNFSHSSSSHLIFNMLSFYFFAPVVENALGMVGLLLIYAGSGLVATIVLYILHSKNPAYRALGASGSVTGIIFATILLDPSISVYMFFIPIPIPGPIFAVLYIALSYLMMKQEGGTVSHEAHIAGGVGGLVLAAIASPHGFGPLIEEVSRWL